MKNRLLIIFCTGLCMASCIRKEPLNMEADILSCVFEGSVLKADPVIGNTVVTALVMDGADRSALVPVFKLTPGAKIIPESGMPNDFTLPQTYKVVSEDGKWEKEYTIAVIDADTPIVYDFENWIAMGPYEIPFQIMPIEESSEYFKLLLWSSGNGGYSMTGQANSPSEFPTAKIANAAGEQAVHGTYGARLETRSTGGFGALVNKRIAAGNLFIGNFDSSIATSNHLGATKFGFPFGKMPARLTGYYKYSRGAKYQDSSGREVAAVQDSCTIYAVMYDIEPDGNMLDGSNALTSDKIVAKAVVDKDDLMPTDVFTPFSVDFEFLETIDPARLADYKYNIAVVCSSSHNGADFEGAVGSTLIVDTFRIWLEDEI